MKNDESKNSETGNSADGKNINIEQLVVFELGQEEYAVRIAELKSIMKTPAITSIPNSPSYIKGIIDLRGDIVMIVDLKEKFSLPGDESKSGARRTLIAEVQGSMFGITVDSVKEILKAPQDSIKETPKIITEREHGKYLNGVSVIGERLILLLDLNKLLDEKDFDAAFKSLADEKNK